jgi:PAS domain S-box-containing protein
MSASRAASAPPELSVSLAEVGDPAALLADLFALSPVPYGLFRADGRPVAFNPAYRAMFGTVPPPEYNLLTDPLVDRLGLRDALERARAGEASSAPPVLYDPWQLGLPLPPGTRAAVIACTLFPVRGRAGELTHLGVAYRDVTSEHHTREQALALAEELRRSEEQFRNLVENLPELAWSAQPDGHIDFYNRRWFEYTGTTLEQMEGWGWQSVHHPEHLPWVVELWKESLVTGKPFEMEFPLRGADGAFRWFLTRVRPLKNHDGRILRWIGTNTDIDEHRRRAAELREAVALRDTFLSVASHELKTPLTSLRLQFDLLERALPPAAPEPTRRLESARRQLGRIATLVEGLLDVSRISSGRMSLDLEELDLTALVREVVERFEPQSVKVGSRIDCALPAAVVGRWDRMRLDQVLTNLLSNALKFGAGKPVSLSVVERPEEVVLTVEDRGIGIEPAVLARLFQRFERGVSDRNYGGLGLGLYVSRQIVEALGGHIDAEGRPGQGARFTVSLPRAPVTSAGA